MNEVKQVEKKPDNRMQPETDHRLIEGGSNIYSYSRRNGMLNLVANQQIKQLDPVARKKFYQLLRLEYGYTQEEIDKIKKEVENS